MKHRSIGILALISLAVIVASAGCSSSTSATTTSSATTASTGTAPAQGGAVTVDLTAQNMAFDKSTITVPVGSSVTINFNNKDSGIPHNFALYNNSSVSTSIFVGQTVTGPATATFKFTAPTKAGTYFFRCDVHPTTMTGTFVVQ